MITVQKEAITALAGLKWLRKDISVAVNVSPGEIIEVLGKDGRGRKPKVVVLDGRTKAGRAAKAARK